MRDLSKSRVLADAKGLAGDVYSVARQLPRVERYEMASQLRRAAVSIVANIAEGLGRGSQGDFERFLRIASGSAAEVAVLVELASDLHDLDTAETGRRIDSLRRQLNRLIRRVHSERG